jgi:3-hydroxyisobutyrate dehydrogenase-like beta-hydroxyacid dehydrogenase
MGNEMPTIGFVGLGHMGGNMAALLLSAGHEVYRQERHREHARALEQTGLRWRDTPREVAATTEVVFTSLPDDAALESASSGPDGILAGLTDGTTWVDVSTVSPRVSRALAERARERGAVMLDAPVSGSVPQLNLRRTGRLVREASRFGSMVGLSWRMRREHAGPSQ